MDNPDSPITISEIPPTRESSGLSLFNRLGEQSTSQISGSSVKNQKSSFSKSLKQTFVDNWLTITTTQSKANATSSTDHKLPPWATKSNKVRLEQDFSFATAPQTEDVLDDIGEVDSECSLPPIDDEFNDCLKPTDRPILDEEYSVMAKEFDSIFSEGELYVTPQPDSLIERSSSFQDNSSEGNPPYLSRASYNVDGRGPEPFKDSNNTQLTTPYNHENGSQATVPYNCDTNSQATIPYNHDDSSQATVPYDYCCDSQDTVPYDANADSQSDSHRAADGSIPVSFSGKSVDQQNAEGTSEDEEVDLPIITSPTGVDETAFIFDSPDLSYEELEELTKIADNLSNADKRHHDQIDSVETVPQSSSKTPKLSSSTIQKNKSLKSPDTVKLVRPEKKQIRSSTLKQPMTIESYFLFSSESKRQGEEDVGRDAATPSSYIGKSEGEKLGSKSAVKHIDSRKRPSLGLSKKNQK